LRPTEGCLTHGCVVTDLTVFFHVAAVVGGAVAAPSTVHRDRFALPEHAVGKAPPGFARRGSPYRPLGLRSFLNSIPINESWQRDIWKFVNKFGCSREHRTACGFRSGAGHAHRCETDDACGRTPPSPTVRSCLQNLIMAKSATWSRWPTAPQARPGGSSPPTRTTPTSAASSCPCSVLDRRNSTPKWLAGEVRTWSHRASGIRTSWWLPIGCRSI
jgi:hypothetical protein